MIAAESDVIGVKAKYAYVSMVLQLHYAIFFFGLHVQVHMRSQLNLVYECNSVGKFHSNSVYFYVFPDNFRELFIGSLLKRQFGTRLATFSYLFS